MLFVDGGIKIKSQFIGNPDGRKIIFKMSNNFQVPMLECCRYPAKKAEQWQRMLL